MIRVLSLALVTIFFLQLPPQLAAQLVIVKPAQIYHHHYYALGPWGYYRYDFHSFCWPRVIVIPGPTVYTLPPILPDASSIPPRPSTIPAVPEPFEPTERSKANTRTPEHIEQAVKRGEYVLIRPGNLPTPRRVIFGTAPAPRTITVAPWPDRPEDRTVLLQRGLQAIQNGEFGRAADIFDQLLLLDPQEARIAFWLAQMRMIRQEYREAEKALLAGFNLDPQWLESSFHPEKLHRDKAILWRSVSALHRKATANTQRGQFILLDSYFQWYFSDRPAVQRRITEAVKAKQLDPDTARPFLKSK